MNTACRSALCALFVLFAGNVNAESPEQQDAPALWGLRLVAFAQDFPAYPSSDDQNLTVLPLPYPVYRGKFLSFGEDLDDLANGQLLATDRINLSLAVNASFPEDSSKLSGRTGMPDLEFLIEGGPELNIALLGNADSDNEVSLALQARAAVSLDDLDMTGRGFVFNPELEYLRRLSPQTELRFRLSSTWASSDYADFFYGVAPDFVTPDRPAFAARSGYLNTELLVGIRRQLSRRLELQASARLWINKGSANEASPLFQRDYDRGVRVALFWTAWESKRRATGL